MIAPPTADDTTTQTATGGKVDPETLVLRARPGRVVRFRRSVIVLVTAAAAVAVVVAAWLALKPRTFQLVSSQDEASEPARPPSETLNDLPSSYAQAPQLGPPLPGDLGRPILDHQRAVEAAGTAAAPAANTPSVRNCLVR